MKNSFNFTQRERKIIIKIIQFLKNYIPNNKGHFINDIKLHNINFKWLFQNQSDNFLNTWNILLPNNIYLNSPLENKQLYDFYLKKLQLQTNQTSKQFYINIINSRKIFQSIKNRSRILSDNQKNLQDLIFLDNLISQKNIINIFIQLYDKWISQKYLCIPYIFKKFIALFFPKKYKSNNLFFNEPKIKNFINQSDISNIIQQINIYYNRYLNTIGYILNNNNNIQKIYMKDKINQQDISDINTYQDKIRLLKQFKHSDIKIKKFIHQLIQFCKDI